SAAERRILLGDRDLTTLDTEELRTIWGSQVRLVPQNPLTALNPSLRIGDQLVEALEPGLPHAEAALQGRELLQTVRLADPERVMRSFPHELSGGMQQRVMLAMALHGDPALLVLDEPTTNLDVTTEAAILDLVGQLIAERDTAALFVSHNLGVVGRVCARVAVLYAGELVEDAPAAALFQQPLHPYTQGLLDSVPRIGTSSRTARLRPIPGTIPALDALPPGCVFAPRCPIALDLCHAQRPPLDIVDDTRSVRCHRWREIAVGTIDPSQHSEELPINAVIDDTTVVLELDQLEKHFDLERGISERLRGEPTRSVRAVDGVDLTVRRARTLGLVGESGSGKTTIARCVVGLIERSGGEVNLLDVPLAPRLSARAPELLSRVQMVFQNPEEALNPYMTVGEALRRPLVRLGGSTRERADSEVARLLRAVKLNPAYSERLPSQLSGGEKQRVAIARAFASDPELILFDESVSALDVSVQAAILNLLSELQQEKQSSYLFITHDLSVVSYLADDIAVVYLGHLMEFGPKAAVFAPPYHPYTEALLSAAPLLDVGGDRELIRLEGDIPSPVDMPQGCRFHTRCPRFLGEICVSTEPPWQEVGPEHRIYCHIPADELVRLQRPLFESISNE
ncbi:ABC transporter ATP-binding protein, partial [Candidatus Gracilibacteria bacterium]|nr:ABC transporter ATP-binding protein [Candidatus Gracilibacteria bacterium]